VAVSDSNGVETIDKKIMDKNIAVRHMIAELRYDFEWPDGDFLVPNSLVTFQENRETHEN
jgi:hypothetical protein